MLEPFWRFMDFFQSGYIILIPVTSAIIVGWVVYGLQKSNCREDEARTRSTWIALVFLAVLTLLGCGWLYLSHPDSFSLITQ